MRRAKRHAHTHDHAQKQPSMMFSCRGRHCHTSFKHCMHPYCVACVDIHMLHHSGSKHACARAYMHTVQMQEHAADPRQSSWPDPRPKTRMSYRRHSSSSSRTSHHTPPPPRTRRLGLHWTSCEARAGQAVREAVKVASGRIHDMSALRAESG